MNCLNEKAILGKKEKPTEKVDLTLLCNVYGCHQSDLIGRQIVALRFVQVSQVRLHHSLRREQ